MPALVSLAYPYILFINILFILFWLLGSSKKAILSLAVILLGYKHLQNYFQLLPRETTEEGIEFFSYNVKQFEGLDQQSSRKDISGKIFDFLETKNADIICIQEMSHLGSKNLKNFKEKMERTGLPRYVHADRSGGPVTFSVFPIIHKGEVQFEGTGNMFIFTDIVTGDDTLRIFNCHLQSYRFTPQDISHLDSISFERQEKNLKEVRLFGSKLKQAFIKRANQVDQLRGQIDQSPYPVIVCGDFNDTPVSYTYQKVKGTLKDAFVQSGSGIGNTYIGRLPSFRIDYILHSDVYKAYNFTIGEVEYSDHYPVSCRLVRKKEKKQD